jgi:hypothetical protein
MKTPWTFPAQLGRALRVAVPVMLLAASLLPTGAHAATLNDLSPTSSLCWIPCYWFLPDLTVSLDTVRLSTNDNQVLRVIGANVANQGLGSASNVGVTLQVPRNLTFQSYSAPAGVSCSYYRLPDSLYPAYLACSGLNVGAGGSGRVSATFAQPVVTSPITETASATVDPAHAIPETNETNNTGSVTFTVF